MHLLELLPLLTCMFLKLRRKPEFGEHVNSTQKKLRSKLRLEPRTFNALFIYVTDWLNYVDVTPTICTKTQKNHLCPELNIAQLYEHTKIENLCPLNNFSLLFVSVLLSCTNMTFSQVISKEKSNYFGLKLF